MPKYLKQEGTGRVYIETDALKQRTDMKPYTPEPEQPATGKTTRNPTKAAGKSKAGAPETHDPATILIDGAPVKISDATSEQLVEYAEKHFGLKFDAKQDTANLATALHAAIDEFGHPDSKE